MDSNLKGYGKRIFPCRWGDTGATLEINNKEIKRGRIFRYGYNYNLDTIDLIVWVKTESMEPVTISLSPVVD